MMTADDDVSVCVLDPPKTTTTTTTASVAPGCNLIGVPWTVMMRPGVEHLAVDDELGRCVRGVGGAAEGHDGGFGRAG